MSFAPIAVVGMACRFPGVDGPAALWADVLAGRDWLAEGRVAVDFDPADVARAALRDAGGPAGRGRAVLGALMLPDTAMIETGAAPDLLAGALGLPATVLDTACASGAFAVVRACEALHAGEADWVLCGAVSRADPDLLRRSLGSTGVLSPTGRCRPFHAEADGFVVSEGAAFLVLKPLAAARAAGDRVHAVIRGAAAVNAGRSKELLAPSERAQAAATDRALAQAGLGPDDLGYVEAQGTGGALADLIELRALRRSFGRRAEPLPIGSLRGRLGHPIAASGLASLIVVIAALRAGVLPPLDGPGEPLAVLGRMGCRLVAAPEPWTGPRRAGLNAFAFGGNHAHLVVDLDAEPAAVAPAPWAPIAVVGLGVAHGGGQQQVVLEAARAAIAGLSRDGVAGIVAAVAIDPVGARRGEPPDGVTWVELLTTLVAGRVAHDLDLRAASHVVADAGDGLALAVRMLRTGEADLMLAGFGGAVVALKRWEAGDRVLGWVA